MSGPVETADAPGAAATDGNPANARPVFERLPSRHVDLAGMPVRRALPKRQRRTIGAWCFVDHFGPARPPEVELMQLGPHPHIGLHTVTWLLSGELVHHDSLGSEQPIRPGQLNLMTSGRGIAHSEETPPASRETQHGAQLWIAMPESTRDSEPAFEHHASLPQREVGDGLTATTLVGGTSSARADTPLVGVALSGAGPGTLPLDPGHEHGLVVLAGAVDIAGERVEPGELVYLGLGRDELGVALDPESHALLLGGEPFGEEILMWWNFVARSRDEVDAARREWQDDGERFGHVPSGLDRIPAPPTMWDRR